MSAPKLAAPACLGQVYWLAFLLVLEPGNILRASQDGQVLSLSHEALRIVPASLPGATVRSAALALVERFPLGGPARMRHLLIHAVGAAGLALPLRIQRSVSVALDRIRSVEALANGDTLLQLKRGGPLRASRSDASAVKALATPRRQQPSSPADRGTR